MQKLYSFIAGTSNRKYHLLILLLCIASNAVTQFTLRVQIKSSPQMHQEELFFAAGSFNNWNPADKNFVFTKENDKWVMVIKNLPANTYQFKCTRGSWKKVEGTAAGKDIANRSLQLMSDTTMAIDINSWVDDVSDEKKHTASANVKIIDTAFFIPQLNRYRRIWLYLPADYATTKKHYPVMYMQDGQNLFDELTSAYGEWGVDECMDTILTKNKQGCIIVGIDNGGVKRMSEYNPYAFTWKDSTTTKTFASEGDAYVDFITLTLKPFIDNHYRTLSAKENTIIAGSSMGGLIAYYAALKYHEVFGKAGIFSPAFWISPELSKLTDSVSNKISAKFFFYIGGKEGEKHIALMDEMAERLATHSSAMIYTITDAVGKHNEEAWHKWFTEFYNFIMADGLNYITKTVE